MVPTDSSLEECAWLDQCNDQTLSTTVKENQEELNPLLKVYTFGSSMDIFLDCRLSYELKSLFRDAYHNEYYSIRINEESFTINHRNYANELISLGTFQKPDVQAIVRLCEQSSDSTTMSQKRMELSADQFQLNPIAEQQMLKEINKKLALSLFSSSKDNEYFSHHITFKPKKIILYDKDSSPDFYYDTTAHGNSSHVATMLIALNSKFEGGHLVLKPWSAEKAIKSSFKETVSLYENHMWWCAFLNDQCCYKVDNITAGVLIFIQYEVYCSNFTFFYEPTSIITSYDDEKWLLPLEDPSKIKAYDSNCDFPFIGMFQPVKKSFKLPYIPMDNISNILRRLEVFIKNRANRNIVIPLFEKYTAAQIKPEMLKYIDNILFNAIIETNQYCLGLSPITICIDYDHAENYLLKTHRARLMYPMTECYEWDTSSNQCFVTSPIGVSHKLNRRRCCYVSSKREFSICLQRKPIQFSDRYDEQETVIGGKYLLYVLVIAGK